MLSLLFFLTLPSAYYYGKKNCLLELDSIIGLRVQLSDQKIESF